MVCYRAVETKGEEHHEEDERPEDGAGHGGDGGGVDDEHQPRTLSGDLADRQVRHVSHVAEHGEDHKPGHKTGAGVDHAGQQSVPATRKKTKILGNQHMQTI